MDIVKVDMPERKNRMNLLLGKAQTGLGAYQMGKTVSGFFQTPVGGTTETVEYNGILPEETAGGSATGSEAAGGASSEGLLAVGGPALMAGAAGAFTAKSDADYRQKGDKAGNAKYSVQRGGGPALKAPTWNYDTINRRMNSSDKMNAKDILDARKSVDTLPLAEADKINISKKLSDMLNFIKIG